MFELAQNNNFGYLDHHVNCIFWNFEDRNLNVSRKFCETVCMCLLFMMVDDKRHSLPKCHELASTIQSNTEVASRRRNHSYWIITNKSSSSCHVDQQRTEKEKKDRNWLMVFEFAQNNLEYLDYLTNCIFWR